jgi:hypothetical protein
VPPVIARVNGPGSAKSSRGPAPRAPGVPSRRKSCSRPCSLDALFPILSLLGGPSRRRDGAMQRASGLDGTQRDRPKQLPKLRGHGFETRPPLGDTPEYGAFLLFAPFRTSGPCPDMSELVVAVVAQPSAHRSTGYHGESGPLSAADRLPCSQGTPRRWPRGTRCRRAARARLEVSTEMEPGRWEGRPVHHRATGAVLGLARRDPRRPRLRRASGRG